MKAICNASPLISFASINKLDLLRHLFDEILIPEAVHNEIIAGNRLGLINIDLNNSNFIKVKKVQNKQTVSTLMLKLDIGESEAIALAIESGIKMIILDDKSARKIARNLGLDIIGTIGLLIKLKELKYIENLTDIFDLLENSINFRIDEKLKLKILEDISEL